MAIRRVSPCTCSRVAGSKLNGSSGKASRRFLISIRKFNWNIFQAPSHLFDRAVLELKECRMMAELSSISDRALPQPAPANLPVRPKVLIIGGGFAGLHAALALAKLPVQVTLIDRGN